MGEYRRGHGGLYAALACGRIDADRLRRILAEVPLPRAADGRLVLAVDAGLRPDAHTSPQRILCHTYGRGKDQHIPVPGWPYSIICALEPGRSSCGPHPWTRSGAVAPPRGSSVPPLRSASPTGSPWPMCQVHLFVGRYMVE
ncbi:hypothetical protein GCM10010270_76410 [Streptomyces violaceus]|nr:hypothetical protein GCM10010270_76410 [Streptomyces janthinus]